MKENWAWVNDVFMLTWIIKNRDHTTELKRQVKNNKYINFCEQWL